ncbi:hypothetical protein AVDCRST_MAG84-3812 [uncultured Microcoleus sp.]|uniref:Uncharacterized protein n=1 Tax=uncultured Microcoleus sp. TaxID=259945 RepID=A0A6J4MS99_9CYAN|nr:hypothetical protein AVDCRST_MAG84-3812 [uncultured Microcoleus sp.]
MDAIIRRTINLFRYLKSKFEIKHILVIELLKETLGFFRNK